MKVIISLLVLILGVFTIKPMLQEQLHNDFLKVELTELKSYMVYKDSLNTDVSKVPVAWHLDHSFITINEVYKVMDTSKAENYRRRFNVGRAIMFTLNKIPRGRAESPEQVKPAAVIIPDSMYLHLKQAEIHVKMIDELPAKAHFKHPFVGTLNKKQAKRFLRIHTNHHLSIIRDILKIDD